MSVLDLFRLDGKRALVTGCCQGIGRAIANGLAEAGANIVGVSNQLDPADSPVGREIHAAGREFRGYNCDFSRRGDLYAFVAEVKREFPRIDILVNNAGTILRKPAMEHPDEYWDKVIEVNLTAQFILAREFGKEMVNRGEGKILFTASLLSFQGGILVPSYSASKSGVARLAMALANEWAARGVNVNAIAPGYIATANTKALREDEARSKDILARIPAGRWGEPDDLRGAAVYLCSHASDYVNGAILVVDGGWMGR
jgi:2-deoxy-D-gluconate 3-dehydrogenase